MVCAQVLTTVYLLCEAEATNQAEISSWTEISQVIITYTYSNSLQHCK